MRSISLWWIKRTNKAERKHYDSHHKIPRLLVYNLWGEFYKAGEVNLSNDNALLDTRVLALSPYLTSNFNTIV